MRLWFVRSSEIGLQAQMVTQISLGILTGELTPGERLPSMREVARTFRIHANTIGMACRQHEALFRVVAEESLRDLRRCSSLR